MGATFPFTVFIGVYSAKNPLSSSGLINRFVNTLCTIIQPHKILGHFITDIEALLASYINSFKQHHKPLKVK